MEQQNYTVKPFDLETALANPEWVYLDDERKVDEFAHLKIAGLIAVTHDSMSEFFLENGNKIVGSEKLVLHVPVTKMKITVFVYPRGTVSFSEEEKKIEPLGWVSRCAAAERGECTRHEFEVEIPKP